MHNSGRRIGRAVPPAKREMNSGGATDGLVRFPGRATTVTPDSLSGWLAHMEGLNPKFADLGLERVRQVGEAMDVLKPAPLSVIVAGTNGKGSTAVCLEQILLAGGLSAGCTLSPHLQRFSERVRLNGREADAATLCASFAAVEAARGARPLTYFEFSCLAVLHCFKSAGVDVAILEIGLGGRLDAFNIVDADVAVITSIGLDHMEYLGDNREAIGAEKAGVFRPGQHMVLGADMPASVQSAANQAGGRLLRFGKEVRCQAQDDGGWSVRLGPRTFKDLPDQTLPRDNCALAVAAALAVDLLTGASALADATTAVDGESRDGAVPKQMASALADATSAADGLPGVQATAAGAQRRCPRLKLCEAVVRQGLAAAWLPGRLEHIRAGGRHWLVDVAHNPLGARFLHGELSRRLHPQTRCASAAGRPAALPPGNLIALFGNLVDKDSAGIFAALKGLVKHWILVDVDGPRALSAAALAARGAPANHRVAGDLRRALALARSLAKADDVILAFGCFAVAGEVRRELLTGAAFKAQPKGSSLHE